MPQPVEVSGPPHFASPTDVFEFYREGVTSHDFSKSFACLAPEFQRDVLFELFFQSAFLHGKADHIVAKYVDPQVSDVYEAKRKQLGELPGRESPLAPSGADSKADADRAEQELLREIFAAHISDQPSFYAEMMTFFEKSRPSIALDDIRQLQVSGEVATGVSQIRVPDVSSHSSGDKKKQNEPSSMQFEFVKHGNNWLINNMVTQGDDWP